MKPKLNSRPCRRLTNREISRALGGMIAPPLLMWGPERVRSLLRLTRGAVLGEPTFGEFLNEEERNLCNILCSFSSCLTNWCGTPNVVTALEYWIESDTLERFLPSVGAVLMESSRLAQGGPRGMA